MIILKILLYVILAVLGIIAMVFILALVLPVKAEISFINGEFRYRLNFSFLKLMDSDGKGFLKRKKKNKNLIRQIMMTITKMISAVMMIVKVFRTIMI